MNFFQLWLTGYVNPTRFIDELKAKPAPHWGFYGQLMRAGMDSLLIYLPVALMGRVPPTPSFISFFPTERYYSTLIGLGPFVLIAQLLMNSACLHVAIRLSGRPSSFDQIMNIVGMAALIVGAFLVPWDWLWFTIGGVDQIFLGITHLIISLWATVLTALGLRRILDVPARLSIILSILIIPVSLPFGIMFMRSPF